MIRIQPAVTALFFSLLGVVSLGAQTCSILQDRSLGGLVSYLDGVPDRRQDAICIAFAIKSVGEQRYEAAAPTLVRFLDFRWPLGVNQKQRRFVIEHDGYTIYPAAEALEKIGKKSLPAILSAMKTTTMSRESLDAAVSAWMTIEQDDEPAGVALLKKEADTTPDHMAKSRLEFAAFRAAMGWCRDENRTQCEAASRARYPNASDAGGALRAK